jgi:CDP-glycerol glycerophosphotransferase
MPARISVVVPVYNVAAYLEACLESLARQTMADLEVVLVDDGSTDASPEIAERFASRDDRFRLVRQANGGQATARNRGIEQTSGEFLAFVDGDDVLPRHAYGRLLGALERTGSDFATGSVRRLTSLGTSRATFLGDAFEEERLETHITRLPALTVDRLACNKLFRRSFWDEHGFRFPEGVRNEDIPVVMTAHYLARSVDVLRATVYLWRRREAGDLSGSQRRSGTKALRDRVAAVDRVSRFLAGRGMVEAKCEYDRSVVGNDLRYFLDVLDSAGDDERRLFLELANDFLDRADERVLDQPLAIDRVKWHLVRRGALPELLEVLRFEVEDLAETPPVRELGRFYGDYPFRTGRRDRLPRRLYRLDEELALVARLDELRWEAETLRILGHAYVELIGAPEPGSQKVDLVARRVDGKGRAVRLRVEPVARPDVTSQEAQALVGLDGSGFVASLDLRKLRLLRRWRVSRWRIELRVRAAGVKREGGRWEPAPLRALPSTERVIGGTRFRAGLTPAMGLEIRVRADAPCVRSYSLEDETLELEGDPGGVRGEVSLLLRRVGGDREVSVPVDVEGRDGRSAFRASVPWQDLVEAGARSEIPLDLEESGEEQGWEVHLAGARTQRVLLDERASGSAISFQGRELAVQRTRYGNLVLVERRPRPVLDAVDWSPGGILTLAGFLHAPPAEYELLARSRRTGSTHSAPLRHDARTGRFSAELRPASVPSLAGERPLAQGQWDLLVAPRNVPGRPAAAVVDHRLLLSLPLGMRIERKLYRVGVRGYDVAILDVERDLDDEERGGFRQRRLRVGFYPAQREKGLRDAVLYDCFGGLEYADSPRAIHEELVRRAAPLEHLWIVRDGRCVVPDTATVVRELSREYYEAYATARFVVASDLWPRTVNRRPEQTWLQTWHGAPLKLLGHELAGRRKAIREYRRVVRQAGENWQYLVSPGPFATPILRRAFPQVTETIECGLPRTDVLLHPDRDRLAEDVRLRLGISAGRRVVLYAPTYRDHLVAGEGYRLGPLLDMAALRAALPEDDVLLFRRHRLTVGPLPTGVENVLDVSSFPDATELLLAVDALVTDYSSAVFDFATTGRPMIFYTPDLETYRDDVRGFSIDFEAEAPGPLLRTGDEVADALRDPDAVRAAYGDRYRAFVATYCSVVDGRASARVVERVFGA